MDLKTLGGSFSQAIWLGRIRRLQRSSPNRLPCVIYEERPCRVPEELLFLARYMGEVVRAHGSSLVLLPITGVQ